MSAEERRKGTDAELLSSTAAEDFGEFYSRTFLSDYTGRVNLRSTLWNGWRR